MSAGGGGRSAGGLVYSLAAAAGAVAGALAAAAYMSRLEQKGDGDSRSSRPEKKTETAQPKLGEELACMGLDKYRRAVYCDYNATTPVFPEVAAVMAPFLYSCFGNPSSPHVFAAPCREAVALARQQVGELVNAPQPHEETICFTSCGTESDNMAVRIAIHHYRTFHNANANASASADPPRTPHVVTCAVEHPAVLVFLRELERNKEIELTVVPVDAEGFVSPADVVGALTKNTCLVTIMHSNNEVGTIQPLREISRGVRAFNAAAGGGGGGAVAAGAAAAGASGGVLLHTDAAQSLGKGVAVDVEAWGVDLATIVGHKFGAPKGVAALFVRQGVRTGGVVGLVGGGQERGRRAGTENVMLIAGLGEAARLARVEAGALLLRMLSLKKRLVEGLLEGLAARGIKALPSFSGTGAGAGAGPGVALRFNGPRKAADPAELESDLALLRIILLPSGGGLGSGSGSANGSSSSNGSGGSGSAARSSSLVLEQLPNTLSVSFRGLLAPDLMPQLASLVACSAGSACHSADHTNISPVLRAMGVPPEYALGTLRLSWGRHTTDRDIDLVAERVADVVAPGLRASAAAAP